MKNKYEELDKQMTKEIMSGFKGQTIEHNCSYCGGLGRYLSMTKSSKLIGENDGSEICDNCNGTGVIKIRY